MKISAHKLQQLTPRDLREIAQLTLVARQASALREGDEALKGMDLTVKGIEKYLAERQASPTPFGVVLAHLKNKLIGWLMLSFKPDMPTQLSSYHPIISPDKSSKDIATKIIKEGVNYAKNQRGKKIQIFLEIAEHLEQMYKTYRTWYETAGLKPRGESHYMLLSLSDYQFESIELSKGFVVKPILDVDKEELYLCYTETFKASLDRWNLDLTEEEREKQFNKGVSMSSSTLIRRHHLPFYIIIE